MQAIDAGAARALQRAAALGLLLLAALLPRPAAAALDEALRAATAERPASLIARDETGAEVALELHPYQPFSRDAQLVLVAADGARRDLVDATRYFTVRASRDAAVRGIFTLRADGRARGLLRRAGGYAWLETDPGRGLRIAAVPQAKGETGAFRCDNTDLPDAASLRHAEAGTATDLAAAAASPPAGYRARVAIETDNEFLALFGGDVQDATAYVGSLMGFVSSVYEAEIDTRMEVSFLRLWETPDPFVQTTTSCALIETGKYWNDNEADVQRTVTHFISGRPPRAGVAWIGVLCGGPSDFKPAQYGFSCPGIDGNVVSNYGGAYGVSMGLDGGFDAGNPQAVWDVVAVAHEIGHNFDSPHTHCYGGIGGSPDPVDTCYSGESGCWAGVASLPGPQGGASGTLMSYCHLRPGGLGNLALTLGRGHGFGVQPERVPSRMLAHVQDRAASNAACLIEPVAQQALAVTATPEVLAVGDSSTLATSGGSGSGAVSFALSDGAASCALDGATLAALAPGSCEVTATKAGDAYYLPASANVALTVRAPQSPLAIATTPAVLAFGDSAQVEVTGGSGSGVLTLALAAGSTACTLDGSTLHAVGIGACEITAHKAGDADYAAAAASLPLSIGRAAQAPLALTATPAALAQGGSSLLSVAGGSGDGAVALTVTAGGALCSLQGATLTAAHVGTGTCTVSANKAGGSLHLPASAAIDIGVFAPAVDLALEIARTAPPPGDTAAASRSYRVSVTNHGPVVAPDLHVQVEAVNGLLDLLWTCNAPAACRPDAGAQTVDARFDLAIGASAQIEVSAAVDARQDYAVLDARVAPGSGMEASTPADDSRTLVDGLGDHLFRHGFE